MFSNYEQEHFKRNKTLKLMSGTLIIFISN